MLDDKFRALIDARRDLETAWEIHNEVIRGRNILACVPNARQEGHLKRYDRDSFTSEIDKTVAMADDRYQYALKAWAEACGKTG